MWLLTGKTAFQYLINSENTSINIGYEAIQNGSLKIIESFGLSRNCIFKVEYFDVLRKKLLVLKQPNNFEPNFVSSIRNEANFFRLLTELNIQNDLLDYDALNSILVFESESESEAVTTQVYQEEDKWIEFTDSVAVSLSDLHTAFHLSNKAHDYRTKYLPIFQPNLLTSEKRQALLRRISLFENKNLRDIGKRIEQLENEIQKIEDKWNRFETIIHRDIRYSNFIYNPNSKTYKLIDFELAAIGDSHWDLAEFIFHLIRKKESDINIEEDPYLIISNLYIISDLALMKYYDKIHKSSSTETKAQFYKRVLQLFAIRLIENFFIGVLNNLWEDSKINLEHNRCLAFINLLEDNKKDDFYLNYFKNER